MQPILGESGVLYDIDKVSYLGTSYSGGYHVFMTRRDAGLDTLEKLRAASGIRIGSQSVGHLIYISGRMFVHLIGLRQPRFVTGYASPELDVAIETGEIDTRSTVADALLHEKPEWVEKNLMDFHAIIEIPKGRKHAHPRFAALADIESFAKTAIERKLVALYRTFVGSGNPFILPPGTPKDRVKTLQEAMRKTYRDPEFFKEYTKLTGLKAEPQMPEELEQTIRDMPRDREAVELFKKLTGPDPLPHPDPETGGGPPSRADRPAFSPPVAGFRFNGLASWAQCQTASAEDDLAEEFRPVKIGGRRADRAPGSVVRHLGLVPALVEIRPARWPGWTSSP